MTLFFYQRRVRAKALVVFYAPFVLLCETLAPPPLFFLPNSVERERECVCESEYVGGRARDRDGGRKKESERKRENERDRARKRGTETDR